MAEVQSGVEPLDPQKLREEFGVLETGGFDENAGDKGDAKEAVVVLRSDDLNDEGDKLKAEKKEKKENEFTKSEFLTRARRAMIEDDRITSLSKGVLQDKEKLEKRRQGYRDELEEVGINIEFLTGGRGREEDKKTNRVWMRRRLGKLERSEKLSDRDVRAFERLGISKEKLQEWREEGDSVASEAEDRNRNDGGAMADDVANNENNDAGVRIVDTDSLNAYVDGIMASGDTINKEVAIAFLRARERELTRGGKGGLREENIRLALEIKRKLEQLEGKPKPVEIPHDDEGEYRKFMRQRIKELVNKQSRSDRLTFDNIERDLRAQVTQEVSGSSGSLRYVEIYPSNFGSEVERIKQEIKEEIEARCNLKSLELQEERYKGIADKNTALSQFVKEMTGKDQSEANPSVISSETYRWLQKIDELDDNDITREGVDKAMAVLLTLGESNPDFSTFDELNYYARFRAPGMPNYFESKFNPSFKDSVDRKLVEDFGADSVRVARQILAAYKEEANYNKEHYLSGIYQFAESRAGLAKDKTYIGSMRVYEHPEPPSHTTYKDEIKVLGFSPLNAPVVIRKDLDPVPGDPSKTKDIKVKGLYKDRALDGKFLRDNERLGDLSWSKPPELVAFGSVKKGVDARDRIVEIGKLGDEKDKVGAISKATDSLIGLRVALQELVSQEAISQAEADYQMLLEARNTLYELSIEKSANLVELNRQQPNKPNFLLPSYLSTVFEKFGLFAKDTGHRIVDQPDYYSYLASITNQLRSDTLEILQEEDMADIDGDTDGDKKRELLEEQERDVYYIDLSTTPGERNKKRENKFFKNVVKIIDAPQNLVRKGIYAVLSRVPFFGKTISKPFKGDL